MVDLDDARDRAAVEVSAGEGPVDADGGTADAALSLFSVMWALAAAWHLLGNPAQAPGLPQAAVAVGVGLVLLRPRSTAALALLAAASIACAWAEAPVVGNHWVLTALVDVGILAAVVAAGLTAGWRDRTAVARALVPTARLCLLGFYSFAAFAKLNSGFFDRTVSCAVVYFEESTDSLGLSALQLGGAAWLEWAVIIGTTAIELAVPVLLIVRRTRPVGVVVALAFHGVLALDQGHQFYDFSSLLAALFVLFLPGAGPAAARAAARLRERLAAAGERVPAAAHLLAVLLPAGAGLLVAADALSMRQALLVGWWPWQLYAVGTVVAAAWVARTGRARPQEVTFRPRPLVLLLVPALVVANGLTPYLEVKTGQGWNMYGNLRTVDGESNHLIVRRTLPLTDEQADVVRILASDDPGLERYVEDDFGLTWRQLRRYLARHPDVAITYERGGEVVSLDRAADDPDLVEGGPAWREKVQMFRAVDLRSPERCVTSFGPAR